MQLLLILDPLQRILGGLESKTALSNRGGRGVGGSNETRRSMSRFRGSSTRCVEFRGNATSQLSQHDCSQDMCALVLSNGD